LGNAAFLAYAILCFIGLRESWADFATVTGIGAVGVAPSGARSSSFKSSTAVTTDT
jgi:hypothetical protein